VKASPDDTISVDLIVADGRFLWKRTKGLASGSSADELRMREGVGYVQREAS
jgi:hypothetical protein